MRHSCWPSIDRACGKRLTFLLGVRQPAAELFRSLLRKQFGAVTWQQGCQVQSGSRRQQAAAGRMTARLRRTDKSERLKQ